MERQKEKKQTRREQRIEEQMILDESVQRFRLKYPDEKACLMVFPTVCPDCGPTTPVEVEIERKFTCSFCRGTCWRTAGTFFERMNRLLPGFMLIWLVEERVKTSINQFCLSAGSHYSTGWELTNRLRNVLCDELQQSQNLFDVETSIFDRVIFRRSKLTPASEHPRTEGLSETIDDRSVAIPETIFQCEEEKVLFDVLSSEPKHIEVIAANAGYDPTLTAVILTSLELANVAVRLPGDRFVLKLDVIENTKELLDEQIGVIADFLEFVKHFGLSRKYLQLHIAHFWARTNTVKWRGTNLLDTCVRFSELGFRTVCNYVSPPRLKMCLPKSGSF